MCGIAGELRLDQSKPTLKSLAAMLSCIRRRGPNHSNFYINGRIGMTHARLSVIDTSAAANQPMHDAELKLTLVFNGTIYNYQALRKKLILVGYTFFSQGDSEVILKAYHRWGEQCLSRLDGVFAFAVWDELRQTLFLARDRLGIKPLYYATTPRAFYFASNTQALLATTALRASLNATALHHHLMLHAVVPAPQTLLTDIHKMRPAHYMQVQCDGRLCCRRYWQLRIKSRNHYGMDEKTLLEQLHQELMTAVQRRFSVADVHVGVLLSGGLDSSLLVALLRQCGVDDLPTYSVGFAASGSEHGDEFAYSQLVAQRYHTKHQCMLIDNHSLIRRLPEAVAQMTEPMVGQDCIAFYLLAEWVSRDIKVVQTGQGADELFAGYFWYPLMQGAAFLPELERFCRYYLDRERDDYERCVLKDYQVPDVTRPLVASLLAQAKQAGARSFIEGVLHMDISTLIVDDPVKRVDNMTMAWGLEARVPFLDHHFVEFAANIDPAMKLRGGGKYILKQLARRLLPQQIIDRPKAYFPVPALHDVQGEFRQLMSDTLNSRACRQRGLFNPDYIDELLASPQAHLTRIRGNKLWHCALLEMWLQRHVDGVGAAARQHSP